MSHSHADTEKEISKFTSSGVSCAMSTLSTENVTFDMLKVTSNCTFFDDTSKPLEVRVLILVQNAMVPLELESSSN